MSRYAYALVLWLATVVWLSSKDVEAFSPSTRSLKSLKATALQNKKSLRRELSASALSSMYPPPNTVCIGTAFQSATANYLDSLSSALSVEDDEEEVALAMKQKRVQQRTLGTYDVSLPLSKPMGMTLSQVQPGLSFASMDLNIDTLLFQQPAESGTAADDTIAFIEPTHMNLKSSFAGIVVNSVVKDGVAWEAGIRPGDILVSTSATLGSSMWPKSTLEGVRSAVASRRVVAGAGDMTFQFQRVEEGVTTANEFELTVARPLGLNIQETNDGYVEVTGFTQSAPKLIRMAVQAGDRIVAIDSSVGKKLWPVSSVAGVISACTSRLPGQMVTMRFERPVLAAEEGANRAKMSTTRVTLDSSVVADSRIATVVEPTVALNEELLSRCQDVLKRYTSEQAKRGKEGFGEKYNVPAMVADKVLDAVATVSGSLDGLTLNLVMCAYLSCNQSQSAIKAFEAACGVKADGSAGNSEMTIHGKEKGMLVPNPAALNLYTASSLLRAHAASGDYETVKRVLSAMEGKCSGVVDGSGLETASWSGIEVDTQAYNVALSAAARKGRGYLKEMSLLFRSMSEPNKVNGTPAKDRVTYNTVIGALAKAAYAEKAFTVFYRMKEAGIVPDITTYILLVKACKDQNDMQELLYDLKDKFLKPTVVLYNAMIKELCDRGKWFEAKRMVARMEDDGLSPDSSTYGFLMKGLIDAGKPSAALMLFEAACSDARTVALTENVFLYTLAITAAAAASDHERAFDLVERMKLAGVKPNLRTLTSVIGACMAAGEAQSAVTLYKGLESPDGKAHAKGIEAMCMDGQLEEASILLKRTDVIQAMTNKEEMYTYSHLLLSCLRDGDFDLARATLSNYIKRGYIPSKRFLGYIIDRLGMAPPKRNKMALEKPIPPENFRFLMYLLDRMNRLKITMPASFYTTMLLAGSRMGGLQRKICFLIAESRRKVEAGYRNEMEGNIVSWEELLENYDDYKNCIFLEVQLPDIEVAVRRDDLRNVLAAERAVDFQGSG